MIGRAGLLGAVLLGTLLAAAVAIAKPAQKKPHGKPPKGTPTAAPTAPPPPPEPPHPELETPPSDTPPKPKEEPAPPGSRWVDRGITMRSDLGVAVDAGFGFGHVSYRLVGGGDASANGVGFNLEAVVGIKRFLDVGLRVGLRVSDDSDLARADYYARSGDRETYLALGFKHFANPELRVRAKGLEKGPIQLALEGRLLLPVDNGTTVMLGVPVWVHPVSILRLDTGLFVPLTFTGQSRPDGSAINYVSFSVPVRAWFQVSDAFFVGPLTGIRINNIKGREVDVPLGVGAGYSVHKLVDVKADVFLNRVNDGVREAGFGVGAGFHLE